MKKLIILTILLFPFFLKGQILNGAIANKHQDTYMCSLNTGKHIPANVLSKILFNNIQISDTLKKTNPFQKKRKINEGQKINGVITDKNHNPISDVYICNLKTGKQTSTNNLGVFSLNNVEIGDTLQISHLRFYECLVIVSDKYLNTSIKLSLKKRCFNLSTVTITNSLKALNVISEIDLQTKPVNSSQEVLRTVPGLFIGQHAGGGKAEQLFLRGFDLDHGTDINITVDGMPVNMVSHAHGQGYADLHFVIPETIKKIDFGKGPYYANKGNFTTSAYVNFDTKERIYQNIIGLEFGSFNTVRTIGMFNLLENSRGQSAYLATEYLLTDGYFESPQNFNRLNIMGKYTKYFSNHGKLSISLSRLESKWKASGQIPQRMVDKGLITRFGAIDDTEGGKTSRTSLGINYHNPINENLIFTSNAFYAKYDFELYSNFTFFLNDPVNGDQIQQKENRQIYGINNEIKHFSKHKGFDLLLHSGLGFRHDRILDNKLSNTLHRKKTIKIIQDGDIFESNLYGFLSAEFDFGKWLINPSIRFDYFNFEYQDKLTEKFTAKSDKKIIACPKFNIIYNHNHNLQLFIKSGKGFHSNDTRILLTNAVKEALPASYGVDAGFIWKPIKKFIVNTSFWYLYMEQELVYVGDEGVVEPSGKTKRLGIDFGMRYQLLNWCFINFSTNYAYARSFEEKKGEDYIPLAPNFTSSGGINIHHKSGLSGGLNYRFIGKRSANEDYSIIAKGYFITDLNIAYHKSHWEFEVKIENLFDSDWNETQFATETRLKNELKPVEEIHFTPGTPFSVKGKILFRF
jgi:hypothetical protein